MRKTRNSIIWVHVLWMILWAASCGGEKLTPYPFSDGDYLEYITERADKNYPYGLRSFNRYKISAAENGNFKVKVISITKSSSVIQDQREVPQFERTYDSFGRLVELAEGKDPGKNKGRFSRLWLPPERRESGKEFPLENYFKKEAVNQGKERWENHDVWVLKISNTSYYYDAETGFLLGTDDGFSRKVLVDTNISGL